jgi:hypothetical protein
LLPVVAGRRAVSLYQLNRYSFRLETDDRGLQELFDELLAGFIVSGSRTVGSDWYTLRWEDDLVRMWFNGSRVEPAVPLWCAVDKLLREVSSTGINTSHDVLAVHAGAVAFAGAGAVLPAPSGSGKSTTAAALVQGGCQYLSDEAALLDLDSGELRPFARSLCLSVHSLAALAPLERGLPVPVDWGDGVEHHVAPRQLRDACIGDSVPLRAVFVPRFAPGAMTSCEPISRASAMVTVIRNAFNFASFAPSGLHALAKVMEDVEAFRVTFSDLGEAVEKMIGILVDLARLSSERPAAAAGDTRL